MKNGKQSWKGVEAAVEAVSNLAGRQPEGPRRDDLIRFVREFFSASAPEDILSTPTDDLFRVARSMWEFSKKRAPGEGLVRAFNPGQEADGWRTPHTVIQVVTDDMPFLVDSITGQIAALEGRRIHVIHHPVICVDRTPTGRRRRTVRQTNGAEVGKGQECYESCSYIEVDACADAAELRAIERNLSAVLSDVRLAVNDWKPILARLNETIAIWRDTPPPGEENLRFELMEFLRWLMDDHFTFVGYREYRFSGKGKAARYETVRGSGLGILRDASRKILRGPDGLTTASGEILHFMQQPEPILITKANVKTRVHRPVHMDYIGVKIFDRRGRVIGERRFVGLFTSQSYARRAQDVPLLRQKVRNVQRRAEYDPSGHTGRALLHVLETFPRDELFQISEDMLLEFGTGILHLMERPRPKAFIRRDKFERFVSALVFVPRENYHSGLRTRIGKILENAFCGEVSVYYALLGNDVLARWHFIIRTRPGAVPDANEIEINMLIEEAAKSWEQHLGEALADRRGEAEGRRLLAKYEHCFPVVYREAFGAAQAIRDIHKLEQLDDKQSVLFDIYRNPSDSDIALRLKIYSATGMISLSECLPMLENLGLQVISENSYELEGSRSGCILDFYMENASGEAIYLEGLELILEELLTHVWADRIENDQFNGLAVRAGLNAREIVILRAYARYLKQIGLPYSDNYVADCLNAHPDMAAALVDLFSGRLDPERGDAAARKNEVEVLTRSIRIALDRILSLDRDRIIRNYLNAIEATLRTNYYRQDYQSSLLEDGGEIGLALKICSADIDELPLPRPWREIFVYSPRVEGIHLRGGPVARGGLRWSDRREDFRTEVLGLMKAQQVKNVVIVPVGAKGGFYPKRLPAGGDRAAIMAEGQVCYRTFVRSLLAVTDNLVGLEVVPPEDVMRWDAPDPYLVVAADKGTATFSDIANEISEGQGFWLGDAFASGGSNGYDHKRMGITARGAWLSVERHFREMGKDVSHDATRVIGIGDMSGDVFGNGMLLSRAIKLIAAFDHRHIFIDPDGDPEASFNERQRLFDLPRSSWGDYDRELISKGGGIFSRHAKSIRLSDEIRDLLDVDAEEMTPSVMISHILKARADLLWIGGIGTYVKSSDESHIDVGDRANDGLRINASALQVKVVGEGGNLGLTQRARIEFARHGGRINTDFLDNSAGVGCSDREVNIKILLAAAMAQGELQGAERNRLLKKMTGTVSGIVLVDNYQQSQAISLAVSNAPRDLDQHASFVRELERRKRLDREIETLPDEGLIARLKTSGRGFTRPELCVLMAYAKMALYDALCLSDLVQGEVLQDELNRSFPKILRDRFPGAMDGHRLRAEITATALANEIINRAGITFIHELEEESGLEAADIAAAYLVVRDAFGLSNIWTAIDALDFKVAAKIQINLHREVADHLKSQTMWVLRHFDTPIDVAAGRERVAESINELLGAAHSVLNKSGRAALAATKAELRQNGVPRQLAGKIAALTVLGRASDIILVAEALNRPVLQVAPAHFALGERIGFYWLRRMLADHTAEDHWDDLAAHAIIEDLADQQRLLSVQVLTAHAAGDEDKAVSQWLKANGRALARAERLIADLRSSGSINIAKLSFAARHMRGILPI